MERPSIKRDAEGFTELQRRFLRLYLSTERDTGGRLVGAAYNATRAAMMAGYSAHTAHSIGHELKNKPHIRAAIDRHFEEMRQRRLEEERRRRADLLRPLRRRLRW